jgi:hypothetical protein
MNPNNKKGGRIARLVRGRFSAGRPNSLPIMEIFPIYENCEVCGGNTMVPFTLDTGMVLCRDCANNTWNCDECCEYFDIRTATHERCPFCGSHKIYDAELKISR